MYKKVVRKFIVKPKFSMMFCNFAGMKKRRYSGRVRAYALAAICAVSLWQPAAGETTERDSVLANLGGEGSVAGLCVVEVESGDVVAAYRSSDFFTPASTQKVLTTAAALFCRPMDYRFLTRVYYNGEIDGSGQLDGDLVIRGEGDPSLGSDYGYMPSGTFLRKAVQAIRHTGIRSVSGRIIADDSAFLPEPLSPQWTWEDVGNYYAAGCYGINYGDNLFRAIFRTGAVGTRPQLLGITPEIAGLQLYPYLTTNEKGKDEAYFFGAPYDYTRRIYGSLPANRYPFAIRGDMPDPPMYLAQLLTDTLRKSGVNIDGEPTTARLLRESGTPLPAPDSTATDVYVHRSAPLIALVAHTLEMSDNLFAETFLRDIGRQIDTTATLANGLERMREVWREAFDVDKAALYDGSGLSPLNRITPQMMAQALVYTARDPRIGTAFMHALPHPGEGTLYNFAVRLPEARNLRLKSGSISGVLCYVGYYTADECTYALAIMVNNYTEKRKQVQKNIEHFLKTLLDELP